VPGEKFAHYWWIIRRQEPTPKKAILLDLQIEVA
jgi:hypothetical protein